MACGVLVPQPGIKPTPPAVEVWKLDHQRGPISYPDLNPPSQVQGSWWEVAVLASPLPFSILTLGRKKQRQQESHTSHQYLLRTCYVLGTVLGVRKQSLLSQILQLSGRDSY